MPVLGKALYAVACFCGRRIDVGSSCDDAGAWKDYDVSFSHR